MNKVYRLKNFMPLSMIIFSVTVYTIGMIFIKNPESWTKGILFGLLFALLKLRLMKITLEKAVTMSQAKAKSFAARHYILRHILTVIVLFVAAAEPSISLFGVFFGLLSMKAAAYIQML